MSKHRIEIICKTPERELKTITVTVEADASSDRVQNFAKQLRELIEGAVEVESPFSIEHFRDYRVK